MTMEKKVNIMVVDDEEIVRDSLTSWLEEDGYHVEAVESGKKALERLPERAWDLMLVDLKMPGMDGIQLMDEVHKASPEMLVIIMTAYATVDTAVKAMKKGAYDYFVKPFNPDDISLTIRKIVDHHKLVQENLFLRKELKKQYKLRDMISKNEKMLEIFDLARTVAKSSSTVLIQGESGTGKELLARAIHDESPRMDAPFISVSCASLTESLLESELFGHEKGAFTGAIMRKLGKFELAQNGTLLLDEISEMHPHLQAKLLRVLQENEIDRVGGRQPVPINVRVMATTNQNLGDLIQKGDFREDLFYRLQVISLNLPPLRRRRGDIPVLAEYFLNRYATLFDKKSLRFTASALGALENASWQGNVRHLENAVARGVLLAQGQVIHAQNLLGETSAASLTSTQPPPTQGQPVTLREMEQRLIFQTLDETAGNRTHAAKLLGISVRTLRNKLHEYRHAVFNPAQQGSQVA